MQVNGLQKCICQIKKLLKWNSTFLLQELDYKNYNATMCLTTGKFYGFYSTFILPLHNKYTMHEFFLLLF